MKHKLLTDIFLNVLLPLLLGFLVYYLAVKHWINPGIKNYLPDALWAYAFVSVLLIIWKRILPLAWVLSVYIISALFELFQYFQLVPGRADIVDIIIYFAFISIGLINNSFFKKKFYTQVPLKHR